MVERDTSNPPLSEETIKEWIDNLKKGDGYYKNQITLLLKWEDECFEYFLERASEIDPPVVQKCFPDYWEERLAEEN